MVCELIKTVCFVKHVSFFYVCSVCVERYVQCVLDYKWIDIQWTVRENTEFSKLYLCIFRMYHFTCFFVYSILF